MRILALDPGGSTGWALFHEENLQACGEVANGVNGFAVWQMPHCTHLVIEDFVVDPGFVGRAVGSEVIGAAYANNPGARIVRQSRGEKGTLPGDTEAERFEWLRSLGFEGVSHTLDAVSHALIFLRNKRHPAALKKYWGI